MLRPGLAVAPVRSVAAGALVVIGTRSALAVPSTPYLALALSTIDDTLDITFRCDPHTVTFPPVDRYARRTERKAPRHEKHRAVGKKEYPP